MARKRAVKTFSGAPTRDPAALDLALAEAQSARVTRHGFLIYALDPEADVLADETEEFVSIVSDDVLTSTRGDADLDDLRGALTVAEVSDVLCMCTGDFAIEFLDRGGLPVEVVRF